MRTVTAKELYARSLANEAIWYREAMEAVDETLYYRAVRRMVKERLLQSYLKTIPMDKVLHDGTGYTWEYKYCLEIANA